jgi:predicted ribosome quality control (RQC) complex YloA/Tae2 family protein
MVWVGRTGKQNDTVTFEIGGPDDLWLHAREMPGAHVILRPPPGREPDDGDIANAASLAAHYSAGRDAARVPIDVTARRHVRKIRGAGPGMVTYRNEYTIDAEPRSEVELGLIAK